jgi:hypothetical protein
MGGRLDLECITVNADRLDDGELAMLATLYERLGVESACSVPVRAFFDQLAAQLWDLARWRAFMLEELERDATTIEAVD